MVRYKKGYFYDSFCCFELGYVRYVFLKFSDLPIGYVLLLKLFFF